MSRPRVYNGNDLSRELERSLKQEDLEKLRGVKSLTKEELNAALKHFYSRFNTFPLELLGKNILTDRMRIGEEIFYCVEGKIVKMYLGREPDNIPLGGAYTVPLRVNFEREQNPEGEEFQDPSLWKQVDKLYMRFQDFVCSRGEEGYDKIREMRNELERQKNLAKFIKEQKKKK